MQLTVLIYLFIVISIENPRVGGSIPPPGTTFQPISRRKPKKTGVLYCAGTIFGTALWTTLRQNPT
jgi:hypothetical protein